MSVVQTSGTLRDVIFTTLLELYLAEIGTCQTPKDRAAREKRALELMQRKNATFDLDHALGNHSITKFYRFEKNHVSHHMQCWLRSTTSKLVFSSSMRRLDCMLAKFHTS